MLYLCVSSDVTIDWEWTALLNVLKLYRPCDHKIPGQDKGSVTYLLRATFFREAIISCQFNSRCKQHVNIIHSFVTFGYFIKFLIYFTLVIYLCFALYYKFKCNSRLILLSSEDGSWTTETCLVNLVSNVSLFL